MPLDVLLGDAHRAAVLIFPALLREAQTVENGERLGPVGARIVTEVFLGLLQGDKGSYLAQDPEWQPFLPTVDPSKTGDDFRMVDLLRYAKVA